MAPVFEECTTGQQSSAVRFFFFVDERLNAKDFLPGPETTYGICTEFMQA
jgi:hypothetical protein